MSLLLLYQILLWIKSITYSTFSGHECLIADLYCNKMDYWYFVPSQFSHDVSPLFLFFFLFIKQIPYFCSFLWVRFSQPPSILVVLFVLFPVGLYVVLWFLCGTWKWIQYSSWDFTNTGLSKIIVMGVLRKAALLNISVIYYLYCVDSNSVCDPL